MDEVKIKVKVAAKDVVVPAYTTPGAAGMDIRAYYPPELRDYNNQLTGYRINPGQTLKVPTGLFFEIPIGYEVQVRPRSGLAAKDGISVLNTPGTIDSDYRGEVCVLLHNHSSKPFSVKHGDRIAQIVVARYEHGYFETVEELSDSERGGGGFGSTGVA